jgi:hypothetical protein
MDDREILDVLKRLEPKKAPRTMDDKVMAATDRAVPRESVSPRRGFPWYVWGGAAAILLLSLLLHFNLDSRVEVSIQDPPTVSYQPPSKEALAAKARILKLKLSRLKRLAVLAGTEDAYRVDLDGLDRKLLDIDRIFFTIDPLEPSLERPTESLNGGKGNEEGFNYLHLPVVPVFDRLDATHRPC